MKETLLRQAHFYHNAKDTSRILPFGTGDTYARETIHLYVCSERVHAFTMRVFNSKQIKHTLVPELRISAITPKRRIELTCNHRRCS